MLIGPVARLSKISEREAVKKLATVSSGICNKLSDSGERLRSTAGLVQALGQNAIKHHL